MTKRSLLLLAATAFLASGTAFADAQSRGAEIGTVISSAIDTAIPGISKLTNMVVDIFKPKKDDKGAKEAEVKKAVEQVSNELSSSIKTQVKGLEPFATQLDAIGPFLQYGFRANAELTALIAHISATPNPTAAQWSGPIASKWAAVKGALDQISSDSKDIETKVTSEQLKLLLLGIVEAKAVTAGAADVLIKNKSTDGLLEQLTNLSNALSTLNVVSRIQIRAISDQVHGLVKWSDGLGPPQGKQGQPEEIAKDFKVALEVLKVSANRKAKS